MKLLLTTPIHRILVLKASSDHFVRAYEVAPGLPYVITNCSNNYGPNHFPEKLIPLFIHNIITNKPLPVYGDGKYTQKIVYNRLRTGHRLSVP